MFVVLRNSNYKKSFFLMLIAVVCIALLSFLIIGLVGTSISEKQNDTIISAAGRLLNSGVDENIVRDAFTKVSPEDYDAGKSFLEQYGIYSTSVGGVNLTVLFIITAGITLVCGFTCMIIFGKMTEKNEKNLQEINHWITTGASGECPCKEQTEGALAVLVDSLTADTTRRIFAVDSLKQDKLFLKNILQSISHQIRTPLSVAKLHLSLMEDTSDLSGECQKEFLETAGRQLIRIEWLVENLLQLARMESGAIQFQLEHINVKELFDITVETFSSTADQKGIKLICDCPDKMKISCDIGWMSQAIGNLCKNALEHTETGGSIILSANETPLISELRVSDTGSGIPEGELPYIFTRFYKKSKDVTLKSVGIGLSLCKTIVEHHGGQIAVRSEIGRGSEFVITFLK